MTDTLYVCPACGASEWLSEDYIAETVDATLCFCKSSYERVGTQMIEVSKKSWNSTWNAYQYDVIRDTAN